MDGESRLAVALTVGALLVAATLLAATPSWTGGPPAFDRGGVPGHVDDGPVAHDAVTVEFERSPDSTVFAYNSHDAVALRAPDGGYRLLVHNSARRRLLFRTNATTGALSASDLVPVTTDVNGDHPGGSIDALVRVDGTYYAYQDNSVYTADRLDAADWERRGAVPGNDQGVYYDAERGVFHLFYEAGNRSDHSGSAIGHATSPNGVGDWTVRPPVYDAPAGYRVGDFAVVERNGVYVLFGDYVRDHPRYRVAVWVNDNLYTNFTRYGTAMAPSDPGSATRDGYGVQDAAVVKRPRGGYLLFAHGHTNATGPRYLHRYPGRVVVDDGAVGGNETAVRAP